MNIGRNIKLELNEVNQGIKTRAYEVMKTKGVLPKDSDLLDFINRSEVHFEFGPGTDNQQTVISAYVTLHE